MSDCKQKCIDTNTRRTRQITIIICAVIVLLVIIAIILNPQRVRPGQIIDKVGTYRFPTGNRKFKIVKDNSGNICITLHYRKTRFYFIPYSHSNSLSSFESERDWFISVDQYNRLWVYHGHWDREWGELRKMASGGTVPYAPAVLMDGMWFIDSGNPVSGHTVVTETARWAGVPKEFFDRIPGRENAQWGNIKPIPESAPKFTKQEQIQLLTQLRRRRHGE